MNKKTPATDAGSVYCKAPRWRVEVVARKKKKPISKEYGPYLLVAVICERVMKEEDGAITLIRIVDQVTFQVPDTAFVSPALFGGIPYQIWMFVSFKAGSAKGQRVVTITSASPDGSTLTHDVTQAITFDGKGETGNFLSVQMSLLFRMEGLHWFHVYMDNKPITSVPFRVFLRKVTSGSHVTSAKK
jgi:uncharacterized protein DUF6941